MAAQQQPKINLSGRKCSAFIVDGTDDRQIHHVKVTPFADCETLSESWMQVYV
jgi:hypothetical protein